MLLPDEQIDILMPVYNRSSFVVESLESIVNQTYKNFRLVIYDDGSTDGTQKIISDYLKSKNVNAVFAKGIVNHGVGFARNRLLDLIQSPYALWQDSDDISHPSRLETLLRAMQTTRHDMIFSAMYFFQHPNSYKQTRTVRSIDVSKYTSREGLYNNTNFATGVFRKHLKRCRFDESLKRKEDILWLTELINAKVDFGYINQPLYYCRRHPERLTYAE